MYIYIYIYIVYTSMSVYLCLCGRVRVSVGVYVSVSLARERAINRPRTRSTTARQVSNAYERDLVRSNVSFGKSFFSDSVCEQLGISASGDWRILCRV